MYESFSTRIQLSGTQAGPFLTAGAASRAAISKVLTPFYRSKPQRFETPPEVRGSALVFSEHGRPKMSSFLRDAHVEHAHRLNSLSLKLIFSLLAKCQHATILGHRRT